MGIACRDQFEFGSSACGSSGLGCSITTIRTLLRRGSYHAGGQLDFSSSGSLSDVVYQSASMPAPFSDRPMATASSWVSGSGVARMYTPCSRIGFNGSCAIVNAFSLACFNVAHSSEPNRRASKPSNPGVMITRRSLFAKADSPLQIASSFSGDTSHPATYFSILTRAWRSCSTTRLRFAIVNLSWRSISALIPRSFFSFREALNSTQSSPPTPTVTVASPAASSTTHHSWILMKARIAQNSMSRPITTAAVKTIIHTASESIEPSRLSLRRAKSSDSIEAPSNRNTTDPRAERGPSPRSIVKEQ